MTGSAGRVAALGTPTLLEANRDIVRVLDPVIHPVFRPVLLAGPSFTVVTGPGDNLAIHRALAAADPGSVLIVVTGGGVCHGFFGEVMMEAALTRGLVGLVIDGGVRDTAAFRRRGFPVFAAGIAIQGTTKRDAGEIGGDLSISGATIRPGDWVVGDDDGVVVLPGGQLEEIIHRGEERAVKEGDMIERIRAGETTLDVLNLRGAPHGVGHES